MYFVYFQNDAIIDINIKPNDVVYTDTKNEPNNGTDNNIDNGTENNTNNGASDNNSIVDIRKNNHFEFHTK